MSWTVLRFRDIFEGPKFLLRCILNDQFMTIYNVPIHISATHALNEKVGLKPKQTDLKNISTVHKTSCHLTSLPIYKAVYYQIPVI